jgi:hypothetical protein
MNAAILIALGGVAQCVLIAQTVSNPSLLPLIPRTWDDEALRRLEVPLADAKASARHLTADYYYRIPIRRIYRSYPLYGPGHEPSGYMEWLKQREPEILWDYDAKGLPLHSPPLRTREDWIRAGEIVFDAPIAYDAFEVEVLRNPAVYQSSGMPVAKDGLMPFQRYSIRKKGQVEVGDASCAGCHSRLMPEGTVLKGAQGNNPFDRFEAFEEELIILANPSGVQLVDDDRRHQLRRNYSVPWLQPDPHALTLQMPLRQIHGLLKAIPPGVQARTGTSVLYPPQVPDLIGVEHRRHLDHTGLVQQRTISDLMRYAALNQGMDRLSMFAGFQPASVDFDSNKLSDPANLPEGFFAERYSDEQLYALALYLYSLTPPTNPNQHDASAAHGEKIFQREGCAGCHTPPLYTNNKLTPAGDFIPPPDHLKTYDILSIRVGTDSRLALASRRGTGYYKVPSLRGVWYRGPFEHNGSVATLEDWFDARRLREDYVPTGFAGYGVKTRAVKGHEFGLKLSEAEKRALIAFLKTL